MQKAHFPCLLFPVSTFIVWGWVVHIARECVPALEDVIDEYCSRAFLLLIILHGLFHRICRKKFEKEMRLWH